MKKILLTTLWLAVIVLTFAFYSCSNRNANQNDNKASLDKPKEDVAILQAIEDETLAFYKKNHALWSSFYVHSPKVHWLCVEPTVILHADGWEDLSQFVATWMKQNPEPMNYGKTDFSNVGLSITLDNNTAFVTMAGSNLLPDGSKRPTVSSRTMIKENGQWKILSMTSYPNDLPAGSTKNIYVLGSTK